MKELWLLLSSISHFCFFRLMYYQLTLAYDFCCVSLLHVRQIRLSFQFALFTFFYMGLLIVSFTATARTEPKLPVNRSFGWLVGLKLSPKPTFELFLLARACFFQRAGLSLKWLKMVLSLLLSIGVWFGLVCWVDVGRVEKWQNMGFIESRWKWSFPMNRWGCTQPPWNVKAHKRTRSKFAPQNYP